MYIEDILNNIQFVYGIEIIPQFKQYKIDKESLSQCLRKCNFQLNILKEQKFGRMHILNLMEQLFKVSTY